MERIVHISTREAWEKAVESGDYHHDSITQEGFIHCSRMEQILKVANTYYPGKEGLVLMWIDTRKLTAELRWEASDGDVYPHLYGPINPNAVIAVLDFPPDEEGIFIEIPQPE